MERQRWSGSSPLSLLVIDVRTGWGGWMTVGGQIFLILLLINKLIRPVVASKSRELISSLSPRYYSAFFCSSILPSLEENGDIRKDRKRAGWVGSRAGGRFALGGGITDHHFIIAHMHTHACLPLPHSKNSLGPSRTVKVKEVVNLDIGLYLGCRVRKLDTYSLGGLPCSSLLKLLRVA